jgi:hypothetical protein
MLNRLQGVFASLYKHKVKYLIIGGIAAVLHGVPRVTFDLDILIETTPENSKNLLDALTEAGLGTATLISVEELLAHEITIFQDRVRIDVQTSTPGITFQDAWDNKDVIEYQGQTLYLVSKRDLISSKLAAARDRDLEDVRLLSLDEPNSTPS